MDDATALTLSDGTVVTIRLTRVADAEAVVALDRELAEAGDGMVVALDQVRSVEEEARRIDAMYRDMSAGLATCSIVAEIDGRIAATADLRQLGPARCRHVGVLAVGVHAHARRRGVARALFERLIERARAYGLVRLELSVRADNAPAQAMYGRLGFTVEGTRRRFVRLDDGTFVDDHVYVRFLDQ